MSAFYRFPQKHNSPHNTGVALITVLLIVFLASMTAVSLATLQQRAIRRAMVLDHQQQARFYTLGAEQEAIILLIRDLQEGNTGRVSLDWTEMPLTLTIDGGTLTVRIRERQGCFNLNNLWQVPQSTEAPALGDASKKEQPDAEKRADALKAREKARRQAKEKEKAKPQLNKAQVKWLERLLDRLELKPEIALAIADWIDPDDDTLLPGGAEDNDYSSLDPPYRAANTFLMSVSELRLVQGIDREAYDKLAPHVCALPNGVPMNINTASHLLLASLSDNLRAEDVEKLLEERPEEGYKDVDEFLNATKITVDANIKSGLTAESQHLLLHAVAEVGDGRAVLYSLLFQEGEEVRVLRRSYGDPQ